MANIINKKSSNQALFEFIHQAHFTTKGVCKNKDLIEILGHFSNPHQRLKIIHIGGTNGKGSTCHFVASVLKQASAKVGLFLSPAMLSFYDRIQINHHPIAPDVFRKLFFQLLPFIKKYQLHFFEIYLLIALLHFANEEVDYAIIEVGIGGRYDPTNIVQPIITAITNIGKDHREILGPSHQAIAFNKIGIQKAGIPLYLGNSFGFNVPQFIKLAR